MGLCPGSKEGPGLALPRLLVVGVQLSCWLEGHFCMAPSQALQLVGVVGSSQHCA